MAALIRSLAVSGSRKSDGTANASGRVYLYSPGTTTLVLGYTSDTLGTAWTTTDGYIPLDAGGRASIWVNDPVDVVIADSSGATINAFLGFNKTRAEQVEIEHDGFTGTLIDPVTEAVSQGLGGKTYLQTALTSAVTSIGEDFKYQESSGATPVNIQDFLRDIWISVKQFGAVGNGIADDTAAIQKAIDRVKARGGGVVYFPPGTYKISTALTLSSANGVRFIGAGMKVTIISNTSGAGNAFTIASCNDIAFQDLDTQHSDGTGTGAAYNLTTVVGASFTRAGGDAFAVGFGHRFGMRLTSVTFASLYDCRVRTPTGAATERAVLWTNCSQGLIVGGSYDCNGSGASVAWTGTGDNFTLIGPTYNGAVLFEAGLTPTGRFVFMGGGGLLFTVSCASVPEIKLFGTSVRGEENTLATGGNVTPTLFGGQDVIVAATSGGAGNATVNAPALLPQAQDGQYWTFIFKNAAGGAVTWVLNAIFVLVGGTAPAGNDGTQVTMVFRWDAVTSELREVSRAQTTT